MDSIISRRSIRSYTDEKIPDAEIDSILQAGTLAPTARNIQPWILVAVTKTDSLLKLASLANHGGFIAEAPVCFAVFCERSEKYYLEDGCAATMNIIHAAKSLGYGTCWVAGDKKEYVDDVRKLLNVDEKYTLISLIPCGKPKTEGVTPQKKYVKEVVLKI